MLIKISLFVITIISYLFLFEQKSWNGLIPIIIIWVVYFIGDKDINKLDTVITPTIISIFWISFMLLLKSMS